MTSSERAELLAELVKAAVERGPGHWDAFLDKECKFDPVMRAEIDSLLKHQKHADQFIEPSALHLAAASFLHDGADRAGQMIEDYRVLSRIGIGGMGEVYLAQDTKLRRKVALKLVRAGMDTSEIVARFRQEEQILASLNHPNIAQLYGAGIAGGDVPFLAMEYIEGVRLDEYCTRQALSTTARLELFRKVCAAVLYAHQRLIIHRDLKPSNILVTADGEPKLLDFGIAKLLEGQDAFTRLQMTLPGVMTPDYASPEQVRGEAMTTSTDVYSLGVLLYEILTGRRPYRLKTRSPDEIARAITDQEPERPSTAIARAKGNSNVGPSRTGTFRNSKFLRGDIDNIVLMALRKEPSRRYASVGQFSEDIRRYLQGLPVLAHKDTLSYRATKFIRRNKIGVAAAALVILTLLSGIVATAWQAKRATAQARLADEQARSAAHERDRAQRESAKAQGINTFLQNILGLSEPTWMSVNPRGNAHQTTLADAIDEAARRAETELAGQPEVLAAVQYSIGRVYETRGRVDRAEALTRSSLDIRRRVLGPEHPETAQSMASLGEMCMRGGKTAEADSLLRDAVAIFRRAQNKSLTDLKWLAIGLSGLGTAQIAKGDAPEGERLLLESLEVSDKLLGSDRNFIPIVLHNLGALRFEQGDVDGAIAYLQRAVEENRRASADLRFAIANSLSNLGSYVAMKGDHAQAESLLQESIALYRATVGEESQKTTFPMIHLANVHYLRGDYRQAREAIDHVIGIQQRVLSEGHVDFARSWLVLGKILTRTGEAAGGESHLRKALELRGKTFAEGHWRRAEVDMALGDCLAEQARHAEAKPLLVASHAALEKKLGARDPRTQEAYRLLLKLYEAWGKPDEAARYRISPSPSK